MKLTIVGAGYVGLVTGACFANAGNRVTLIDVDKEKIAVLQRGECPIFEPGLADLLARGVAAGRLFFSSEPQEAYDPAEVIFLCVGTPPNDDGSVDLRCVFSAAEAIAEAIERSGPGARPKLVVVKSTVPVGTTHQVRDLIRERSELPFYVADNPEFLKEGAAVDDFTRPDRVVCGVDEPEAGEILRSLYEPFVRQGNPILVFDVRSAEMVKYASNAMLACRISFINEIAGLCEHYGADILAVREGMCSDRRIGKAFLHPGLGFGGSCFPKDTLALIEMGRAADSECRLSTAAYEANQEQRRRFWRRIEGHFGSRLAGSRLAFWGATFKPETDDVRESPALWLMSAALRAGVRVRCFDPVAASQVRLQLPEVTMCEDMYETLNGCDALVVCTEWGQFRSPNFDEISSRLIRPVVFDGRNIYRCDRMESLGFTYYSVGRRPVNA